MMREYSLHGPYVIPRIPEGRVHKDRLITFWESVNKEDDGLSDASGCYIFGIRAGRGARPWYVGQAKTSFKKECFAEHKLKHYNSVLDERQGTPILFLVARKTPKGKFQKRMGELDANNLENLLIGHGLRANDNLLNKSGTAFWKETRIPGLLNGAPGNLPPQAKFLRRFLSL